MTSSRRRPDRPIRSVELRIRIEADKETSKKVRRAVPEMRPTRGADELVIEGEGPAEVEAKARDVLERLRKTGVG